MTSTSALGVGSIWSIQLIFHCNGFAVQRAQRTPASAPCRFCNLCRSRCPNVSGFSAFLGRILKLLMGMALPKWSVLFSKYSKKCKSTLYACRNQVVPFFLLLISAIHSPQLLHKPSQTPGCPSIRLVSVGPSKAIPVAALIPWVKLLSYQYPEFFRTSHLPGLQIPHQPSRLLPWPRTKRGV